MIYTGYLRRSVSTPRRPNRLPEIVNKPYILVTTGGGGDGENLIEWVLRTYEAGHPVLYPSLLVLGPFMQPERQNEFLRRAQALGNKVDAITFDAHLEELEANAVGVVAMGGYNTFCEILSLDKRAVIVPRTRPRMEQYIRASRAQELGLVQMLEDDNRLDPAVMAKALLQLPYQNKPSESVVPGLLEGLDNVNKLIEPWLNHVDRPAPQHAPAPGQVRPATSSR